MAEEESELLDQEEVDALLEAASTKGVDIDLGQEIPGGDISTYDFKRPERVSRDQLRSIEMLHEVYARNLSASLSEHLRTVVELKLDAVDQITYSEFIMGLPNPTFFNVVNCDPIDGNILLEMNPSIVFPIYDRLMGGGDIRSDVPDRPLTEIEWKIIDGILDRSLEELETEWEKIQEGISFDVEQQESNPQLIQVIPPNELVILISFEMVMGEHSGMMNLCVPFMVLEPVIAELTPQTWYGYSREEEDVDKEKSRSKIAAKLKEATLELVVDLVKTKISFEDLINLKPGDKIRTDKSQDEPVVIRVGDKEKYLGQPGVGRKNHRAVKITGPIDSDEEMEEELINIAQESLKEEQE